MADIIVAGSDSVSGTNKGDVFIVDPNNLVSAHITDSGGNSDTLRVYDRPGRTAGEFVVQGNELIWRNFQGDEVRITLNGDGSSPIEYFQWQRLPEDGTPYTQTNRIVLPGTAITTTNVTAAGTTGNDALSSARFDTYTSGFTELYGNDGNDTLTGSDTTNTIAYGGNGRDLMQGIGNAYDDFSGDAGSDVLRAQGGNDWLDGGIGNDKIFGGNGSDKIYGGKGSDSLTGGTGNDSFHFLPREKGADAMLDYAAGDTLVFEGIASRKVHATQSGSDVLINVDGGGSILVKNTLVADLTMDFT